MRWLMRNQHCNILQYTNQMSIYIEVICSLNINLLYITILIYYSTTNMFWRTILEYLTVIILLIILISTAFCYLYLRVIKSGFRTGGRIRTLGFLLANLYSVWHAGYRLVSLFREILEVLSQYDLSESSLISAASFFISGRSLDTLFHLLGLIISMVSRS